MTPREFAVKMLMPCSWMLVAPMGNNDLTGRASQVAYRKNYIKTLMIFLVIGEPSSIFTNSVIIS